MNYRDFGKTGIKVSSLGFGCMGLPTTDGQHRSAAINEPESTSGVCEVATAGAIWETSLHFVFP